MEERAQPLGDGIIIVEDSAVGSPDGAVTGSVDSTVPVLAAVREMMRRQSEATPLSPFARFFGIDPVPRASSRWFRAAIAELRIAEALAELGDDWLVVSSVPISTERPRLEYLLVGPPGLIAVSMAYSVGQHVWVGERTFLVEDELRPIIQDSEADARLVGELVAASAGTAAPVTPAIVVVEPAALEIRAHPRAAEAIHSSDFSRWLRDLPRLLAPSSVRRLAAAAADPATWPLGVDAPAALPSLLGEFETLRREVARARRRRLSWVVVGIALSYGLLFVRFGGLAAFGVQLAFPADFPL
ncbi:hypothetical protein [Lacisediminihabitans profunda]|uniref:NERD domain-containing protein n=1 Tax=Lacisediminihabitans profunda TaxID=2594790 RepID=A0A5C8UV54_9MICO|nr:hypothetical protein [Lacisediminihabitans profunda]TXN31479.1 hypothetical protein FVP33_08025 [Lacisediminihabitans profunda]